MYIGVEVGAARVFCGFSQALRASGILMGAQEERIEGQFEGIHSSLSLNEVFAVGP